MLKTPYGNSANGMKFSTYDNDNDESSGNNNADYFKSPWWWNNDSYSALNGGYGGGEWHGAYWYMFNDDAYALTSTAMKLSQIPQ